MLLTVAKDVGFKEGVVPLDLLERLGAEPKGLGGVTGDEERSLRQTRGALEF